MSKLSNKFYEFCLRKAYTTGRIAELRIVIDTLKIRMNDCVEYEAGEELYYLIERFNVRLMELGEKGKTNE